MPTFIPLIAMIRKDLQLFFSDRRSVIVTSSCRSRRVVLRHGVLRSGADREPARIGVAIVDEDRAPFRPRLSPAPGRTEASP
jgi:hypothetical protein